jgi:DNA-binding NarL/FixJ family response regulator
MAAPVLVRRGVLIVDDDALLRDMIAQVLEKAGFDTVTAANAIEAISLTRTVNPDAVVIDIDLGIGPDGLQLAEAITRESPGTAMVFLTNLPSARFSSRPSATVLDSVAYLRKSRLATSDELVVALNAVLSERVTPEQRHDQNVGDPLAQLTSSQLEVLRMVSEGLSNDQIAILRHSSTRSVERLFARTLEALHIDPHLGAARVHAARTYIMATLR